MAFEVVFHCGRTESETITLYAADGSTAANVTSGSTVRVKIGRTNAAAPLLDLSSDAPTTNGSSVTVSVGSNVVQLRLAQADTASLLPGAYQCEIDYVDNADANVGAVKQIKLSQLGTCHLIGVLGGSTGL